MTLSGSGVAAGPTTAAPARSGRRWSLSTHLLIFGLTLLLPVLALGAVSAWEIAQAYRAAFEARLQDTARALGLALDSEFEALRAAALAVASAPTIRERRDDPIVQAWLAELGRALGEARITILTAPEQPADGADELVLRILASGRPAVSNLYRSRESGGAAVAVGVPVAADRGPARVVLVTIPPQRLVQVLAAQRLAPGVAGLADGNGVTVARSSGDERPVGLPAPWYAAAEGLHEGVFQARNFEGMTVLFGFRRLTLGEDWGVAVGAPLAAYEASWQRPLVRLGIGALLAVALAAVAAAALARRILAPVRALSRQAEEVADGGSGGSAAVAVPAPVAEFETLRRALLRADAALRAGAAEFRTAFEQAPIAMSQSDPATGRLLRVNSAYCALLGRPAAEILGRPFADFIHPEDREAELEGWFRMARGEVPVFEAQKRFLRPDGSIRWVVASISPVRDPASGRILRTLAASQDVTERKAAEERQWLLMRELDHRAKNVLAVVQATLRLTPRTDAAEYARAVEGRVAALARAHSLLVQARWTGAELRAMLEAELAVFLGDDLVGEAAGRVEMAGPAVTLSPAAVQALSMALHELATNATKHGALAVPDGRLLVRWTTTEAPGRLRFRWAEQGGPPVAGPPLRRGFGSRVLEATVRDQLGGRVQQAWLSVGLDCLIDVPLDRVSQGVPT